MLVYYVKYRYCEGHRGLLSPRFSSAQLLIANAVELVRATFVKIINEEHITKHGRWVPMTFDDPDFWPFHQAYRNNDWGGSAHWAAEDYKGIMVLAFKEKEMKQKGRLFCKLVCAICLSGRHWEELKGLYFWLHEVPVYECERTWNYAYHVQDDKSFFNHWVKR